MSLTQLAVFLVGVYLILLGASVAITSTVTLIFGIAVVALVVIDSPRFRNIR